MYVYISIFFFSFFFWIQLFFLTIVSVLNGSGNSDKAFVSVSIDFQNQPREGFYKKICSEKFNKIHRKTPVPKSLF